MGRPMGEHQLWTELPVEQLVLPVLMIVVVSFGAWAAFADSKPVAGVFCVISACGFAFGSAGIVRQARRAKHRPEGNQEHEPP